MADDFNRAKYLFEWNKRVFGVMGVWPLQSINVKFIIWIAYLLFQIFMELADLFHVFGNVELMVLNLLESLLEIIILVKLMVMRFSRKLVKLMKRIIDSVDARFFDSPEEMEIYLNYNRIAKSFFKLWFMMGISSATLYHLKPLEFRIKAVLQNESMPFILPYHTHVFFEVNNSSRFWFVWITQSPTVCIGTFHAATIGYLFSLILHVCGQLSVLSFRIKNLAPDLRKSSDEDFKKIFHDIVHRHRHISGLAKDINEVFGLILLEELFLTTLLIGLISYGVITNVGAEHKGVFFSLLLYGATMLVLIYGYCIAGECLIFEVCYMPSANLYEAYYQCQWCDMPNSFKKQLIICMIGASQPIQLTGGGFYIFSLVSFTGVIKTSASYISMLRTMI